MTLLLQGIVGSQAYGLAREDSDTDRLGVFAAPSTSFFGLNPPVGKAATIVRHEPEDLTLHEVGKFCGLALQCNPTVLELLWLTDEFYEVKTEDGHALQGLRSAFLSRARVRNAYFGYAEQQFARLSNKQRFPNVPVNRIEKHARHLKRLLSQGFQLYRDGVMDIQVRDPDAYFTFGERVAGGDLEAARTLMADYEWSFDNVASLLPEQPDSAAVEAWLRATRTALL